MQKIIVIAIALIAWATAYGQKTMTLEESKSLALKNNKTLQNSALEKEAAELVRKNAFTNYFPKVSLNAFGMYAIDPLIRYSMPGGNLPVYDGNPANLQTATQFAYSPGMELNMLQKSAVGMVSVAQPLFVGGKLINGNKLAKLNVEAKEQQQQLSEKEILLKTEQQYWQLIALQEKQKTLEKYEALLSDIRKQVDDAYKSGLVIKNDLLKVQIKQSELEADKNKLVNGKKLATMQFCQTIGIPFDSMLVFQQPIDLSKSPLAYYTEHSESIATRTEYQLLEKSVEAARLQTKMKTGDYLPTVSLGLTGYHFNTLQKGQEGVNNGLAFVTVSIPVSDWWGGTYMIKEQKIKQQVAENTLEDTKGLLNLQMEKAWVDVNEAWKKISIMKETAIQAEENLKLSQTGYTSGVVTLSDVLEAQALVTQTADNLVEAETQYQLAVTTYLQVTGR